MNSVAPSASPGGERFRRRAVLTNRYIKNFLTLRNIVLCILTSNIITLVLFSLLYYNSLLLQYHLWPVLFALLASLALHDVKRRLTEVVVRECCRERYYGLRLLILPFIALLENARALRRAAVWAMLAKMHKEPTADDATTPVASAAQRREQASAQAVASADEPGEADPPSAEGEGEAPPAGWIALIEDWMSRFVAAGAETMTPPAPRTPQGRFSHPDALRSVSPTSLGPSATSSRATPTPPRRSYGSLAQHSAHSRGSARMRRPFSAHGRLPLSPAPSNSGAMDVMGSLSSPVGFRAPMAEVPAKDGFVTPMVRTTASRLASGAVGSAALPTVSENRGDVANRRSVLRTRTAKKERWRTVGRTERKRPRSALCWEDSVYRAGGDLSDIQSAVEDREPRRCRTDSDALLGSVATPMSMGGDYDDVDVSSWTASWTLWKALAAAYTIYFLRHMPLVMLCVLCYVVADTAGRYVLIAAWDSVVRTYRTSRVGGLVDRAARGAASVNTALAGTPLKCCYWVGDAAVASYHAIGGAVSRTIAAWAHFIVTVSLIALLIAGTIGVVLFFGVRCFEESTEAMQSTKLFVEDAITAQGWASFIDPNVTADAVEGTDAALERTVNWFESRWPNETMVVYKVYEVYQSYEFFKEHSEPPPVAANDYFHGEDQICDLNESNQSWWNVWHWPAAMGLGFDWHGDSAGDADHSPGDDVSWAFLREVMLIAADYISNVLWTVFGASTSIVSFMVSLLLFLNLLYYLLVLERNWLSSCFALLPSREGRALHDALTDAVRQVFVVNGKVMAFNALYTWLLFNACGVEYYVYSATLGSVLSCVFPFLPLWCIAIPGGIVLAVRLSWLAGCVFWILHYVGLAFADTYMYDELVNCHPSVLGLSIIAGMAAFGPQGAVIGPLLVSVVVASAALLRRTLRESQARADALSSPSTLKSRARTVLSY